MGNAVSLHAQPRATKDLDILISPDTENSKAVYDALTKFGAPMEGLSAKDFTEPDNFFRMGTPPVMVDIMTKISGVEFESAWPRRVTVAIDDALMVSFISRDDLLAAKIAAGRAQDLADVDALRESAKHENVEQHEPSTGGSPMKFCECARKAGRTGWPCGDASILRIPGTIGLMIMTSLCQEGVPVWILIMNLNRD